MKMLLDTHTFLWLVDGSPKLSGPAYIALTDPLNLLHLSVASIWELAIKTSRSNPQLRLTDPLDVFVSKWAAAYQIAVLPIESAHALQVVHLPDHHRDPFDRLLIAQAQVEGMTVLSGDTKFQAYSISIVW